MTGEEKVAKALDILRQIYEAEPSEQNKDALCNACMFYVEQSTAIFDPPEMGVDDIIEDLKRYVSKDVIS